MVFACTVYTLGLMRNDIGLAVAGPACDRVQQLALTTSLHVSA